MALLKLFLTISSFRITSCIPNNPKFKFSIQWHSPVNSSSVSHPKQTMPDQNQILQHVFCKKQFLYVSLVVLFDKSLNCCAREICGASYKTFLSNVNRLFDTWRSFSCSAYRKDSFFIKCCCSRGARSENNITKSVVDALSSDWKHLNQFSFAMKGNVPEYYFFFVANRTVPSLAERWRQYRAVYA